MMIGGTWKQNKKNEEKKNAHTQMLVGTFKIQRAHGFKCTHKKVINIFVANIKCIPGTTTTRTATTPNTDYKLLNQICRDSNNEKLR